MSGGGGRSELRLGITSWHTECCHIAGCGTRQLLRGVRLIAMKSRICTKIRQYLAKSEILLEKRKRKSKKRKKEKVWEGCKGLIRKLDLP